jgi:hypothetical protein
MLRLTKVLDLCKEKQKIGVKNKRAGIAQLVEYKLPKLGVAGSNPVARSISINPAQFPLELGVLLHNPSGCENLY